VESSSNDRFEIRVGLFIVIALILLAWGWSWLKGFSFHSPQRFIVKFHDVAGLSTNAPVNVNGVRVGTVEKIELKTPKLEEGQTVRGAKVVYCHIKIANEDVIIPEQVKVTIQTLGLVGAKYIEVNLPEPMGDTQPVAMAPGEEVWGQDPVRIELYANQIVQKVNTVADSLSTKKGQESLQQAAENAGPAVMNLKEAAAKLNENMGRLNDTTDSLTTTAKQFNRGATSATAFFDQGTETLKRIEGSAGDFSKTTRKLDRILDNPALSADLKETMSLAKQTAEKINGAIHELDTTLTDKPLREDMLTMLGKLSTSTENIRDSMKMVKGITGDHELKTEVKEILGQANTAFSKANDAADKVNHILNNESLVGDAHTTMQKLQNAADEVDLASKNINKILGKKHPLWHMIVGGGGKAKVKKIEIKETDVAPKSDNGGEAGNSGVAGDSNVVQPR
jgi:ABC-type transporter Mla subunit MlaD